MPGVYVSSQPRTAVLSMLLVLWVVASFAVANAQQNETGRLSGAVVDAATGKPLPGVNIILKNTVLGTSTDLNGEFHLSGIRRGTYAVMASMIGYKIKTYENVSIAPGSPVILNFKLEQSFIETSPVIVTASKKSKSLAETPNSVSVITSADIRKRNSFDIREALRYAPGVSFVGGQVNIRGTTGYSRGAGSRVLLLTDGVPTMPGDSGDIKWDVVPFTVVEKVEVVKGAASALYGSSAISGVLNIITKEPSRKPTFSVRVSGGMYDDPRVSRWKWTDKTLFTNQQDLYFSNTFGNLGVILSGGRRNSRGYKQNTQFLRWNLFGKSTYKFSNATHVTFTGSYASDDHGETLLWQQYLGEPIQPFRVPAQESKNTILSTKLYLNSTFSQLVNQNFAHKLKGSYYRNRFDNDFVDNQDFSKSQRFRLEYQADVEPSIRHSLTLGVEGMYDIVDGSFFGRRKAYILGSYLQHEYRFSDRFSSTVGLRFDYNKVLDGRTEYQVSPKFGIIYNVSEVTTIRGSVGRGFRAPSIAELFTNTSASGFQVIPNPELQAESSWSAEVGLSTSIAGHILLDTAIYQERFFDFINPSLSFQDSLVVRFRNVQDARIRGVETNLTTSWFRDRLRTVVSYVFVDPRDLQTHRLLTYRPQHILTASLSLKPGPFELGMDYRFASKLKREQLEVFPDDPRVATKVVDARAGVNFGPYSLVFNVENLFEYNYTQIERNLEPTRKFSVNWQADF